LAGQEFILFEKGTSEDLDIAFEAIGRFKFLQDKASRRK